MILGAVLAGGLSTRFGSDKAVALLDGRTLIDRVVAALARQTDAQILCGRERADMVCVPDRPARDLGPLGGLNAALRYAADHGFEAVVSVPCDTPYLPDDLVRRLSAASAGYAAAMPVIGYWPSSLADRLDRHLATTENRAMRRWIDLVQARPVAIEPLANINTREDLARLKDAQDASTMTTP